MNRHEFVANHCLALNVEARAARDWANGVNHSKAYAGNAWVHEVYHNQWQELAHQWLAHQNDNDNQKEAA